MSTSFSSILQALNNYNRIEKTNDVLTRQLTTGKMINSPADDPALFSRITKFNSEISSYDTYLNDIDEGNTVMSVVTDAATQQLDILQQMLDITGKAKANGVTGAERAAFNAQYQKLYAELDPVVNNATYNSQILLDGTYATTGMTIAVGPGQTYALKIANTTVAGLNTAIAAASGLPANTTIQSQFTNQTQASNAYDGVKNAISVLTGIQGGFGTDEFILNSRANLLESKQTSLQSLIDKYQQVDVLKVSAQLDRNKIIQQYALAVIASANQSQQNMVDYLFPKL